ncbi:MAG: type II toxin-antitoxin system HigA family antitoxin [Flavisolibacter sp.]
MEHLKYTVIKNRTQYNAYCNIVDGLIDLDETSKEQEEEMKLLTVLIEKWDSEHSTFNDLDPIQLIKSLLKDHNLNPTKLMQVLGISKSYLSEILNYKKGLSKEVIRKLARHFKMTQEAFNRPYLLKNTVQNAGINRSAKVHKVQRARKAEKIKHDAKMKHTARTKKAATKKQLQSV